MPTLPLTRSVFALLSTLIEERAGLHYSPEDQELLADKVSAKAQEAGFVNPLDYWAYLKFDPRGTAALDALIETLLVHETYFFRDPVPLELVADDAALAVRAGRRPRIWCAACSTGEEPLTLAIMLHQRGVLDEVSLVATDYSQRVLERAQRGEHNLRSMRALPPGIEGRYLKVVGGRPVVRSDILASVVWRQLNLVDEAAVAALGIFDAILCRNVLIYFQDEKARRVVESLTRALLPGGTLVVSTSESLLRFGTTLVCEERRGAFVYTRPKEGA